MSDDTLQIGISHGVKYYIRAGSIYQKISKLLNL